MDESKTSFSRWLWNGLRWLMGLSAGLRSDKEQRLGAFLLITNFLWYLLPAGIINDLLHVSQIFFGFALMIHGMYLASQEEVERFKAFRMFMGVMAGEGVSPDKYAEYYGRKKKDNR